MGLTKEVVQRARAQNILKEEDVIKPQPKPVSSSSKKSKAKPSKSITISKVKKLVPPPKPKIAVSIDGVEKREKEKPLRQYAGAEEETKLDDEI